MQRDSGKFWEGLYRILFIAAAALTVACVWYLLHIGRIISLVGGESYGAGETVTAVACAPDRAMTVTGDRDGNVTAINDGRTLWEFTAGGSILDIQIGGEAVYVGADDRIIHILDWDGRETGQIKTDYRPVCIAVNRDGSLLAAATTLSFDKNRILMFDGGGNEIFAMELDTIVEELFVSAGSRVIYITMDGMIRTVDVTGEQHNAASIDYNETHAAYDDGRGMLLVSDLSNTVSAYDDNLSLLWQSGMDQSVEGLAMVTGTGRTILEIQSGELLLLNDQGIRIAGIPAASDIVEMVYSGAENQVVLLYKGGVSIYDVGALEGSARYGRLRPVVGAASAVSGLLMLVCLVNLFPAVRKRLWTRIAKGCKSVFRHRLSYLMLLPTIALLFVFNYIPIVSGLVIAFTDYTPGLPMKFVGLTNFVSMVKNSYFWTGVGNMLIFLATDLLKALIPSVVFAELILAMKSKPAQYWTRVLLYIPGILPGIAGLLIWTSGILGMDGLINGLLRAVGLSQYATSWLGNEHTAIWALVFIGFPWIGAYIIIYGALIGLPDTLYDSSKIDGCGWLRRIRSIDIPLIAPQLKYLFVVSFIASVQDFGRIYVTTAGGPGHATYTPMLELYFNMSRFQNYGEASAMGLFLFVVIFAATLMNMRMRFSRDG